MRWKWLIWNIKELLLKSAWMQLLQTTHRVNGNIWLKVKSSFSGLCPGASQTFISIRVRGWSPWSEGWQTRVWVHSINLFTCSTPMIRQHHSPNIRPCLMVWPACFVFTLYPFSPNSFSEPVLGSYLESANHLCLFSWMKGNVNTL